jgi:hypothetical protein
MQDTAIYPISVEYIFTQSRGKAKKLILATQSTDTHVHVIPELIKGDKTQT